MWIWRRPRDEAFRKVKKKLKKVKQLYIFLGLTLVQLLSSRICFLFLFF